MHGFFMPKLLGDLVLGLVADADISSVDSQLCSDRGTFRRDLALGGRPGRAEPGVITLAVHNMPSI
jgi:hypothetical protein